MKYMLTTIENDYGEINQKHNEKEIWAKLFTLESDEILSL